MRRSLICLCLFAVTVCAGIAVRFAPLHLPPFLYKYLGSALWAVALYWFVGMLLPRLSVRALSAVSSAAVLLVEFSRLVPERHVDAFRLTLAGKLLLGRYFSWKNIVAYLLGITLAALLDYRLVFGTPATLIGPRDSLAPLAQSSFATVKFITSAAKAAPAALVRCLPRRLKPRSAGGAMSTLGG